MHSEVQTAIVTLIISYKQLNFASYRYTGQYEVTCPLPLWDLQALWSYKPLPLVTATENIISSQTWYWIKHS